MVQELAKAKEALRREREAEVFILHPQGPVTSHTVPQPFDLHDMRNKVS